MAQLEKLRPPTEEALPQGDPPDVVAAGGERLRSVRENAIDIMAPVLGQTGESRVKLWILSSVLFGVIGFFAMVVFYANGKANPDIDFPRIFYGAFTVSQVGGYFFRRGCVKSREKERADLRALDSIKLAARCAAWQKRREMDYQANATADAIARRFGN